MIKRAVSSDFSYFYDLYMHPQINPFLLYEMMDEESFKPIFEELINDGVLYIYEVENEKAGMFKLIPLKHRNNHIAYLGGVAIAPNFAGKGLGKQMFQEIISFAKTLGILRIELSVASFNEKAINLYKSVGFEQEGVLKKYTHLKSKNQFIDEILMAYLY